MAITTRSQFDRQLLTRESIKSIFGLVTKELEPMRKLSTQFFNVERTSLAREHYSSIVGLDLHTTKAESTPVALQDVKEDINVT